MSSTNLLKSDKKHITSACTHCGLPVRTGPSPRSRQKQSGKATVFCCFGCRMVWEVERHSDSETGGSPDNRLSPLNLLYLRFALALIASIFLIFISITLHFESDQAPVFLRYISLVLATGVMFLLAGPFLDNLKREISDRRLSLASLIFTGSGAAYLLSAWNTLSAGVPDGWGLPVGEVAAHTGPTYFETSAMILTFYIGSLLIDTRIKRGMAAYSKFWQPQSTPEVLRVEEQGEDSAATVRTTADTLAVGDRFLAEAGQPVLTDAQVASGNGFVDESHLTGEPDPVSRKTGDSVSAGSISIDGGLTLRVTHPYKESSLREYIRQARAMRSRPGYYERAAARGATILLVFVIIAAFFGLGYHSSAHGLSAGLQVFLAVLLIGCPCAFSISTPAALWVANQRLHRSGVIAMGGSRALEKLSDTRVVLFDKTGTLTEGVAFRSIQRVEDNPEWPVDRLMSLAGGVELDQPHPFARAFRRYLDQHELEPVRPDETRLLPGRGMEGWLQDRTHHILLVNNSHPMAQEQLAESELGLFLDDRLMLRLRIYQPPRHQLENVIYSLRKDLNIKVAVLTGDPSDVSSAMPGSSGSKWHDGFSANHDDVDYHKGCTPEQKAALVDTYRKTYGKVMFVGDGTNDLMAINKADLGAGVYNGSLSIKNHADFVLYHPHLGVIPEMLQFSGKITGTIRGNFFWAVAYNAVGIGVALMGWLHPFFAILAMMLSSLFVTFHSGSLQRRQKSLGELENQVNNVTDAALLQPGVSET